MENKSYGLAKYHNSQAKFSVVITHPLELVVVYRHKYDYIKTNQLDNTYIINNDNET